MTWARLDDSFHSHPKTIRAWHRSPEAVGLYVRALSWIADHNQDGHIPDETVVMWMPSQRDREKALKVLVEVGFVRKNGAGWVINDYLAYNPSKEDVEARRKADRQRKRGDPL